MPSQKPTLLGKLSRLRGRVCEPEWRRYGYLLLLGKGIGIALIFGMMYLISSLLGSPAVAADAPPVLTGNDVVNPVNTAWTLVAAFLVFGMQVGFTMLEAGFCRFRETVNVLMECIVDTCLCGLLFYAIGFAFMFSHGNGLIGYNWFFLQDAPTTYETTGVAFLACSSVRLRDTCSTIVGAMIGRTAFVGDLLWPGGVGFVRLLATGPGGRTASWPRWALSGISWRPGHVLS
jgi:Amt family ammonium transporter